MGFSSMPTARHCSIRVPRNGEPPRVTLTRGTRDLHFYPRPLPLLQLQRPARPCLMTHRQPFPLPISLLGLFSSSPSSPFYSIFTAREGWQGQEVARGQGLVGIVMNSTAAVAAASSGYRPPFTASQWQELEHQALIFKYLVAGIPVPPELLLPIRKSFVPMAARFYHPSMGYCSFYGKKLDSEPGRCRRTDGKKWRCSKDAYPESKYCERHMHRGRNSSRKPVETQILAQSQSPSSSSSQYSSTVTSLAPPGGEVSAGGSGGGRSFPRGISLHSLGGAGGSSATQVGINASSFYPLLLDRGSYGVADSRDYRCPRDVRNDADGRCSFLEASGSARGSIGLNHSLDSDSRLMPPPAPSYSLPKSRNDTLPVDNCAQLQSIQGFGRVGVSSLPKQQQHFSESHYNSSEAMKNPLRPFFDEWPKTRGLWSDLKDERSKRTSFSATQLSISFPTSSDFTTSSRSPSGVP